MDPLSLVLASAAAGGVAGKLAEKFVDYLGDVLRGHDRTVQENAARNAAAFVTELSKQVDRLSRERSEATAARVEAGLDDPDVAITVRAAIVGAARTASPEKHDALARAVAERLVAAPESNEALASALAVEAIPRLSSAHLRYLGIAAVVFVLRPLPGWYLDSPPDGDPKGQREGARYDSFATWLRVSLERLHLGVTLGELQVAHLAATGCLTYERRLSRDLTATLHARGGADLPERRWEDVIALEEFVLLDVVGRDLAGLWRAGLQHVTLTPAGRLIGTAVFESVGGDRLEVDWSRGEPVIEAVVQDAVWDGRTIRREFLSALDAEVTDRAERGVEPWRSLLQH